MIKKKTILLAISTLIIFFITTIGSYKVFAAETNTNTDYSCKLDLKIDKTALKRGETATIQVVASKINAGEGISAFVFTLDVDNTAFDIDVLGQNELGAWQYVSGNPSSGNIYLTQVPNIEQPATKDGTIVAAIELTAKEDATLGAKDIKFTNMSLDIGKSGTAQTTENNQNNSDTIKLSDITTNLLIIESCNVSIAKDKTSIKKGESVTYSIKASNIKGGDGIGAFNFRLDYDTTAFTCKVKNSDSESWILQINDDTIGEYVTAPSDFKTTKDDCIIAKIIFTAKSNATAGNKTIVFKDMNINFKEGEKSGTYSLPSQSSNVTVTQETASNTEQQSETKNVPNTENEVNYNEDENNENEDEGNENEDNEDEGNEDEDNEDEDNEDEDEKQTASKGSSSGSTKGSSNDKDFPKTGIMDKAILPLIIGIFGLAGISIFKYKKMNI